MSAADKAASEPDNPVAVLLERAVKGIRFATGREYGNFGELGPFLVAVAGLLEREAERATLSMTWDAAECTHEDDCRCEPFNAWFCAACGDPWGVPGGCGCWDAALKVAAAWLGETGENVGG